nr:MAG TPA: hypothetical protein [Caudoviricetes sp.]
MQIIKSQTCIYNLSSVLYKHKVKIRNWRV